MATETQLIGAKIEWHIEQFRIRLPQKIEVRTRVRIVAGRAISLSDRAMVVRVFLQQSRHVLYLPAIVCYDFPVMTGKARIKRRFLQKPGQY